MRVFTPKCANCEVLASLLRDQHAMLMAFHQAGHAMAGTQLRLAEIEADVRKSEAQSRALEAASLVRTGSPQDAPRFGVKGHVRESLTPE